MQFTRTRDKNQIKLMVALGYFVDYPEDILFACRDEDTQQIFFHVGRRHVYLQFNCISYGEHLSPIYYKMLPSDFQWVLNHLSKYDKSETVNWMQEGF